MTKKLLLAAGLAAVMVLTACSGPGSNDGGSPGGDGPLVAALGANPDHLNSAITTDASTSLVGAALYDTLLLRDNDFEVVPHLVESWDGNEEATEYTLNIRSGVQWHDDTDFTAEDVVFNLTEVFPLHPTAQEYATAFESAEVVDDTTVHVNFSRPFAPFLALVTDLPLLPAHIYEGTDIVSNPANSEPIGTGPYVFSSQSQGDFVRVAKNENYWGPEPQVEEIVFSVMPDGNARSLALQSGDIDYLHASFFEISQQSLFVDNPDYVMTPVYGTIQSTLFFFNLEHEILSDYEVRKAIFHAINREEIAANVFHGNGEPTRTPVPNQVAWAAHPDIDYTEMFNYDPAEAERILDAAGYTADSSGNRFSIELVAYAGRPTWSGPTEIIQANLQEVGINVSVQQQERNLYIDNVYTNGNFDTVVTELAAFADPSLGVTRSFICNPDRLAFMNASQVCFDDIDETFAQAAQYSDIETRQQYFYEGQEKVTETLNALPLISSLYAGAARTDRFGGFDEAASKYNLVQWHLISVN